MRVTRSALSAVPAIAIAFAVSRLVEAQRLRRAGGGGVGALGRVVEALRAYGCFVGEPALHLVGDRERGQQLAAGGVRVLGGRQHRREVVARVAGLAGREVGVVEVEVADERPVVEGGSVGCRRAAADQRAERIAAEVLELRPDRGDGRGVERAERAAERVEHADLELAARRLGEVVPRACDDEAREPLDRRSSRAPAPAQRAPRARRRRCARCRGRRRRASVSRSRARRRSSRSFSSCAASSSR